MGASAAAFVSRTPAGIAHGLRLDPCSIRLPTTRAARNLMTIVGSAS
jgi:hypothetical protein